MAWLASVLVQPILNFLWAKVALGAVALTAFVAEYIRRKKIVDKNLEQANTVEAIAAEIQALLAAGKPVPPELEQRLVDESSKIVLGKPVND